MSLKLLVAVITAACSIFLGALIERTRHEQPPRKLNLRQHEAAHSLITVAPRHQKDIVLH